MASHHVLDFSSGFNLLPIIQFAFLHGCDIQEVPGCMVRLPLISEQVKGLFDIRYLLRIETWLVIIPCQTNNAIYCLTENVACFEQQETQTANNMILPCNPVFKPCGLLCMFRLLAAQLGLVLTFQVHQFTVMVALHGLDFTL